MIGPLAALVTLLAGLLGGEHAHPDQRSTFGALALGVIALAAAWFTRSRLRVALAAAAMLLVGFGAMGRSLDGQQHSTLTSAIAEHSTVTLRAQLTADPEGPTYSASVLVRADLARGEHRTLLATASGDGAMPLRALEAGDRVVLSGRLAPLRRNGFDERIRWQHAVARLEDVNVLALSPPAGLRAVANVARDQIVNGTAALAPKARALTAGFLLGDTRAIPPGTTTDFRESGLSQLLAVSGEIVAFVLALFGPVLRRLRLGLRSLLALAVIVVFAAMTRFEPSVLRASMMAAIALLATLAGRPVSTGRVLVLAVIALLVADPFLLHSVGFALSCAASGGIAVASQPIAARLRGPRFVREPLAVSLAAQAGVLPVQLWAFGRFPIVTPVANLAAAPVAELLGVYGLLASLVAGFVPRLGPLLQQPTALLVGWIAFVAHVGAAVPVQLNTRATYALGGLAAAVASLACLRARRSVSSASPG